jgi:hypothetical protein
MDVETVKMMIQTRLKAAQQNGNTTEASLMFELLKMSQELEALKQSQEDE